jgi:hypothetical protein
MLNQFEGACRASLPPRREPGAREKTHVKAAAVRCAVLWETFSGKRFVKNFESADNHGRNDFISPGPRFVESVLRALDPS